MGTLYALLIMFVYLLIGFAVYGFCRGLVGEDHIEIALCWPILVAGFIFVFPLWLVYKICMKLGEWFNNKIERR